ncbi:MAG: DUF790 family protein [SAR324 cluster bacterium]|nr:DUF790 family protein [SAR324 cluster bacterium]
MLTKDLLRNTIFKDEIRPLLIDPNDRELINAAEQLLEVFKKSVGKTRETLLVASKEVIDGIPCEAVITRGFEKLLLDQTEFDTSTDAELVQFRQNLFTRTSALLAQQVFVDLQAYHDQIREEFQESHEELAQKLYADLPPYQQVLRFKTYSPQNLLHRYNCAQVQGLLLRSNHLIIQLSEVQPKLLRQLCKYLRFHQLLAQITSESEGTYLITIDGPLNLFFQTQKYGLNLANFFPAVLHQPRWQLRAQIQLTKQKKHQLLLDDSCGIRSHYQHYLAYVPQEIELFQQTFQKKTRDWNVEPAQQFVPLEGELYCFPDYVFKHISGTEVSMELFHAWHLSHLTARLRYLEKHGKIPLIVGMAKSLEKDSQVAEILKNSKYFSDFGFIFRDMPSVDKVLTILERFVDKMPLFSNNRSKPD